VSQQHPIPLRPGTPAQFARLRALFAACDFSEAAIAARCDIASIYDFRSPREGRPRTPIRDALDLLIRWFLDSEGVSRARAVRMLGDEAVATLRELGLLQDAPGQRLESTVMLYPTCSLHIASDSGRARSAGRRGLFADVVYPAITTTTRAFVAGLPDPACENYLELCSGTGIAALIAAPHVRQAWAVDITERATRFAAFNAALNGLDNVTALRGDLYEPLGELTFDRIVAQPPYVPTRTPRYIYRDGGEDGERVTARIIAGLPARLRPGGSFYCACVATDRAGAPLEQRIRAMLGEQHADFDVLLITRSVVGRESFCAGEALSGSLRDARYLLRLFRSLEVENAVLGWIVLLRHTAPRPPLTLRKAAGGATVAEVVDHFQRWEVEARAPGAVPGLLAGRPRPSSRVRIHVTQRHDGRSWLPEAGRFSTDWPFPVSFAGAGGVGPLLMRCDGVMTAAELAAVLRAGGEIPADVTDETFADLVRTLAASGLLEMELT
jgi:SAM-dependent methyltransferase